MDKQNQDAFKKGMTELGVTNIKLFELGMEFDFKGIHRQETYQQCMIYILNGLN
jgi:hypothetical protein